MLQHKQLGHAAIPRGGVLSVCVKDHVRQQTRSLCMQIDPMEIAVAVSCVSWGNAQYAEGAASADLSAADRHCEGVRLRRGSGLRSGVCLGTALQAASAASAGGRSAAQLNAGPPARVQRLLREAPPPPIWGLRPAQMMSELPQMLVAPACIRRKPVQQ